MAPKASSSTKKPKSTSKQSTLKLEPILGPPPSKKQKTVSVSRISLQIDYSPSIGSF